MVLTLLQRQETDPYLAFSASLATSTKVPKAHVFTEASPCVEELDIPLQRRISPEPRPVQGPVRFAPSSACPDPDLTCAQRSAPQAASRSDSTSPLRPPPSPGVQPACATSASQPDRTFFQSESFVAVGTDPDMFASDSDDEVDPAPLMTEHGRVRASEASVPDPIIV